MATFYRRTRWFAASPTSKPPWASSFRQPCWPGSSAWRSLTAVATRDDVLSVSASIATRRLRRRTIDFRCRASVGRVAVRIEEPEPRAPRGACMWMNFLPEAEQLSHILSLATAPAFLLGAVAAFVAVLMNRLSGVVERIRGV